MCNETPFTVEKISPRAGIEPGPLDQWASAEPTELAVLLIFVVSMQTNVLVMRSFDIFLIYAQSLLHIFFTVYSSYLVQRFG